MHYYYDHDEQNDRGLIFFLSRLKRANDNCKIGRALAKHFQKPMTQRVSHKYSLSTWLLIKKFKQSKKFM